MQDDKVEKSKADISRRSLLGRGAAVVGGVAFSQSLRAQTRPVKTASSDPHSFSVVIGGEAMVTRPFSMHDDPGFLGIVKLFRDADVAYAHLETNIASDDEVTWTPRGSAGIAGYLISPPQIAKDLAWAGIDVVSAGMNHSFDWGPDVMLATTRHLNDSGIATAGTGINLEVARAPTFFETRNKRMSIISIASGNSVFEWAGLPKGLSPGRPGVNPMRVKQVYELPHEAAVQMKSYGRSLGVISAAGLDRPEFNLTSGASAGSNGFSSSTFRDGDKFLIYSEAHPGDVRGNLRSVDQANKMSDFVMVAHHNSTSDGSRGSKPSSYVVDFARKAIDQGADMYIGHGWHTFVGIEIYKGKPIIFGVGSLFWQSQYITRVPADSYESWNVDMDTLTQVNAASGSLHPEGNADWGWTAIFKCNYRNDRLVEIELHPIEMGFDYSGENPVRTREVGRGQEKYLDGSPRLAVGTNRGVILKKLQDMNAQRGTRMDIRGGIGVITVGLTEAGPALPQRLSTAPQGQ